MALRRCAGIRGSVLLLCLVGASGCATRPVPAAPPPAATPQPTPLMFGPTPDEQLRQLQTRVDVLTDRVNDIYLRQVQMEQRLEEIAEALEGCYLLSPKTKSEPVRTTSGGEYLRQICNGGYHPPHDLSLR